MSYFFSFFFFYYYYYCYLRWLREGGLCCLMTSNCLLTLSLLISIMGIDMYEKQCRDTIDGWKGFNVVAA